MLKIISNILHPLRLHYRFQKCVFRQTNVLINDQLLYSVTDQDAKHKKKNALMLGSRYITLCGTQQSCGNCWLRSEVEEAGVIFDGLEVP
jgi:hypothetical protein